MRNRQTWLLVILLVALALRLFSAFYMGDTITNLPGIFDQFSYHYLAQRVIAGHGFSFATDWWPLTKANAPTAHWSFLYTLYLAAVYAAVGVHPLVARLIQASAAGLLMPWLTYRLGKRALNERAGLAAAAISAVYAYFFYYAGALMTETFYILAVLWALNVAGDLGRREPAPWQGWFHLGLALATAVLLRQTFLPVVVWIGVWLLASRSRDLARTLNGFSLSLAILALAVLPWTIRNALAFHQFVPLNTNAGYAFFWANHPVHGTDFQPLLPDTISYQALIPAELRGLDEAALEKALLKRGWEFVRADPRRFTLLTLNRISDHFQFWPTARSGLVSNLARAGSFGLFLPFMIYGVTLALRKSSQDQASTAGGLLARFGDWLRTPVALWLGFFIGYTFMHLISWAHVLYRLPTDAVMIEFAGLALVDIQERISIKYLSGKKITRQKVLASIHYHKGVSS